MRVLVLLLLVMCGSVFGQNRGSYGGGGYVYDGGGYRAVRDTNTEMRKSNSSYSADVYEVVAKEKKRTRRNIDMGIILGLTGVTFIGDMIISGNLSQPVCIIPVIGPLIAYGRASNATGVMEEMDDIYSSAGFDVDLNTNPYPGKALYLVSGLIQVGFFVDFLYCCLTMDNPVVTSNQNSKYTLYNKPNETGVCYRF